MTYKNSARHAFWFCCALFFCLIFVQFLPAAVLPSGAVKFENADSVGEAPYNSRIIDGRLIAGGSLFNPCAMNNSDEKVREYLRWLKDHGAYSVILLHVPRKDSYTRRLETLCMLEKMELYKLRMNGEETPDSAQLARAYSLMRGGTYLHCMWGCDRTGAMIAKYLRDFRGYSGRGAYDAVIGGGSHAGKIGGFKELPRNHNLLLFFWPEVVAEAPDIYRKFCR